MDKSIGRYVGLGFIGATILVAAVLGRAIHQVLFLSGVEDWAPLGLEFPFSRLAGGVIAVVAGIICFKNENIRTWADEVGLELSKVTWPTRQETWAATMVVIVTVTISAVYLGLFDAVWLWASNALLHGGFGVSKNG